MDSVHVYMFWTVCSRPSRLSGRQPNRPGRFNGYFDRWIGKRSVWLSVLPATWFQLLNESWEQIESSVCRLWRFSNCKTQRRSRRQFHNSYHIAIQPHEFGLWAMSKIMIQLLLAEIVTQGTRPFDLANVSVFVKGSFNPRDFKIILPISDCLKAHGMITILSCRLEKLFNHPMGHLA